MLKSAVLVINDNQRVAVNCTVTVISSLRPPPKLLITSCIPPRAHRHGRGPPWWKDKFSALRRLRWRLLSQLVGKRNFYLRNLHLAPPLRMIPSEFRRNLLHHKTRVHGLSCGVVFEILRLSLTVLIQYRLVMDGEIDTQ